MIFLTRRLEKWQKFEMSIREFFRGILLEDTIDPDDFGFTKLGDYQLDACGGLAGHFVLTDCTSATEPGARGLKEKIKDFHNKQPDFARDVAQRFGAKYPRLHYVICTLDIDIRPDDVEYANDRNIRIIPAESFREWMKLAPIMSPTLGFQFIEFLAKEKVEIPGSPPIRLQAMRLPFTPGGDGRPLYAFTATPDQMLKLGYVYRLEYQDVKGYQRGLKIQKLRDINRFLAEDPTNGFPNSLLVAFDEAPGRELEFIPDEGGDQNGGLRGTLTVPAYYGIAEIIDGQHRLFGYFDFTRKGDYRNPLLERRLHDQLLVVAYPDPQKSERPRLFLDINSKQTKIPTRQIWSMMGQARPDTHMGYIANLVKKLDSDGPLRDQIQIPGETRGTRPINVANLGKGIQDRHLVDSSPPYDWNLFEGVRGSTAYPVAPQERVLAALNDLFSAARESSLADWTSETSFLKSNNGVNVLLRVYVEVLKFYRQSTRQVVVSRAKVKSLLSPILSTFIHDQTARTLLRRTSTEAGREAVAAEIMLRIRRRNPGFAASHLAERSRRRRTTPRS